MDPTSLYFHIPFCAHRCSYCDFNTYAGLNSLIPDYVNSLCKEIQLVSQSAGARLPIHTIFFGGGTPSLLNQEQFEQILEVCRRVFDLPHDLEITIEANPGSVSQVYLHDLHTLGINRLSLGVQSANPAELQLLERTHSYPDAIRAYTWARYVGYKNINLDLIFGLPNQDILSWEQTLSLVVGLKPDHLSLYALTIEKETPLGEWTNKGLLPLPDPDLAADMYESASNMLQSAGYIHYEISNWALGSDSDISNMYSSPALACQHNLQYWHNAPYLGFGAGAHGYINSTRSENIHSPKKYIEKLESAQDCMPPFPGTAATKSLTSIDLPVEIGETMMMGLRLLREGISEKEFLSRFGISLQDHFSEQIKQLEQACLIEQVEINNDVLLRLSQRGYLLANRVFVEFI